MRSDTVKIIGPGMLEIYLARMDRFEYVDVRKITSIQCYDGYFQLALSNPDNRGTMAVRIPFETFQYWMQRSLCMTREQIAEEHGLDLLAAVGE